MTSQLEFAFFPRRLPRAEDPVIDWDSLSGFDLAELLPSSHALRVRHYREVQLPFARQMRAFLARRKGGWAK